MRFRKFALLGVLVSLVIAISMVQSNFAISGAFVTADSSFPSTLNWSLAQAVNTKIDCGKKDVFFGDFGCIIPSAESYLGNTRCPVTASFPNLKQEKGFFKGYVYDSCNRPIARATVVLGQGNSSNQSTTTTDSKGFYKLESRYVVGAYVKADMHLKNEGNDYSMDVLPKERIFGRDGGIQNIHYDMRDSQMWFADNIYNFEAQQNPVLEFTLEPLRFFDGTKPRTKQVFSYQSKGSEIKFSGVKYGVYNVSVQAITPTGRVDALLQPGLYAAYSGSDVAFEKLQITLIGTELVGSSIRLKL